jgi:putative FmdB family regulatory protein
LFGGLQELPLYEYECPKDGTFEKIQKFSDPPLDKCPTCGGPVERLLSAPAIQFKGTGWYITDYARKGDSGGGKKDAAKGGGSSESSKDTSSTSSSTDGKASGSSSTSGSDKKK